MGMQQQEQNASKSNSSNDDHTIINDLNTTTTTDNNNNTNTNTDTNNDDEILKLLPIRMISTVVRGYGRGSNDLGIPTANLDLDPTIFKSSYPFDQLPTGIYWGYARVIDTTNSYNNNNNNNNNVIYKAAVSIGYCPTYGNTSKTIEPHLIANTTDPRRYASCTGETILDDFYNNIIRLTIIGYIRPELPFEGIPKLIDAIKNDILTTEKLASYDTTTTTTTTTIDDDTNANIIATEETIPVLERMWVKSNEPV